MRILTRTTHRFAVLLIAFAGVSTGFAASPAIVIDNFVSVAAWQPVTSDGVDLKITTDAGRDGNAMRLDFDFRGKAGYVIARHERSLEIPENFQFTFWIRGDALANNLEFKLVDPSGDNVWWVNRRDFVFSKDWTRVTLKKRHFSFAWGPLGGGDPKTINAIEIAVTAGNGGKGTVWMDDLVLTPLDPPAATLPAPRISASTAQKTRGAQRTLDHDAQTEWRSTVDGAQELTIDYGTLRELGGFVIDWDAHDFATDYEVLISEDGSSWEPAYRVTGGNGGRDYIYLPETTARYARLRLLRSSRGRGFAVREIDTKALEWSASANAFLSHVALDAPRGDYPRYLLNQQTYWTVVGVDGDTREALISEDGMVETGKGQFSLEPFLYVDGQLLTWADLNTVHSLRDGYLPVPTVRASNGDVTLEVTAVASGPPETSSVVMQYRVSSRKSRDLKLYLALRPLQVNPPWQFLGTPGGHAPIRQIEWRDAIVLVNETQKVIPMTPPAAFGAVVFDQGNILDFLRKGTLPRTSGVVDERSFASAALEYPLRVTPEKPADVSITFPLHGNPASGTDAPDWPSKLNRVSIQLPASASYLADTVRSNVGFILVNRDGAAIQPGSRSYERSWIRDGSLTSAALLRLGHEDAVREFIEWYAPYQFENGKVPCCVDRRGADPVPEHDSHGQLIFIIAEYYRYTKDRAFLESMWPYVKKAVEYIDFLRKQRMTPDYLKPEKRAFYGLVPESISHEGYSAKPMHSYWDDFFVLKGLKDSAEIAVVLGKAEAVELAAMRDEFRRNLLDSITLSMAMHNIDYIPGSVELGDFDATSTTIALAPVGEIDNLPRKALERTFEKYWENAVQRRNSGNWDGYTPYELRTVGTFVRLGQKARAHALLDFFFQHQRPQGWNAWAEVVWREPRTPKFVGDIPHTWVGSDFIRSFTDMLVYERDDGSLVLGAGVLPEWVRQERGVVVQNLRTHFGALSFTMRTDGANVVVEVRGPATPPGGIIVHNPLPTPATRVLVNSVPSDESYGTFVLLRSLPATAVFAYESPAQR